MNYELQFLVMVKTNQDLHHFLSFIRTCLREGIWTEPHICKWMGNLLRILHNDLYDNKIKDESEDGFLYYPIRIEVYPVGLVSVEHQVNVAIRLKQILESAAITAVIAADFEELLK